MNIDYKALQVFDRLIAEGSVSATARALNMTPSAVSHTVARLRRLFDDPLFESIPGGMRPTPYALKLAGQIAASLAELEALWQPTGPFDPVSLDKRFTIATTDYIGLLLLPELTTRLAHMAPELELIIQPLERDRDIKRLKRDEIDLIIWNERQAPQSYHMRSLFSDRLCAIARQGHPRLNGETLTLERFREIPQLAIGDTHGALKEYVDQVIAHGCQIQVEVPHFLIACNLIAQSELLGLIGELAAQRLAESLKLQCYPLPIKVADFNVAQLWHERRHSDAAHRWVREQIALTAETIHPVNCHEP